MSGNVILPSHLNSDLTGYWILDWKSVSLFWKHCSISFQNCSIEVYCHLNPHILFPPTLEKGLDKPFVYPWCSWHFMMFLETSFSFYSWGRWYFLQATIQYVIPRRYTHTPHLTQNAFLYGVDMPPSRGGVFVFPPWTCEDMNAPQNVGS